jgi:hypothetical protein
MRAETRRMPVRKAGAIVTKDEIIQMTIQAMGFDNGSLTPEEEEYRGRVEATLMERLPPGTNLKTCKDFGHLAVGCCECCHSIYEHYEMELEDLPSGEKAWICCSPCSALFEPGGMDELQEEVVDLERFLGFDDGRAADAPANLQQGNEMHTELITHTCGHDRTYSRPSAEALKLVAEYAKTTLCWDCWKLARAKGER